MNKITYEEEKAALILGITSIFTVYMDIQMIYFLLVFIIKYVSVETPTPVTSYKCPQILK